MTKDMTNGSPMKLILGFSVPLLFGFLFQQFYNLMDTLIVGRFLGVDDLAAGRFHRLRQLSYHRILYGSVQRICDSSGTQIRRRRL